MIKVDVFILPGCGRCSEGLAELRDVVRSFGPDTFVWEERDLLEDIDYAVELGVLSAPAIAVAGKLAFASAPSPAQLQAELARHVKET